MSVISHASIGTMLVAVVLFAISTTTEATPQKANGTAPNSQTSIQNGDINSDHVTVFNDNNDYTFNFAWTMSVPSECCDEQWYYKIEFWEDDTFSDDYVGDVQTRWRSCEEPYSDTRFAQFTEKGTYFHNAMGTGSEWECEIYYDAASDCGTDNNYDPPGYQWAQPNQ